MTLRFVSYKNLQFSINMSFFESKISLILGMLHYNFVKYLQNSYNLIMLFSVGRNSDREPPRCFLQKYANFFMNTSFFMETISEMLGCIFVKSSQEVTLCSNLIILVLSWSEF